MLVLINIFVLLTSLLVAVTSTQIESGKVIQPKGSTYFDEVQRGQIDHGRYQPPVEPEFGDEIQMKSRFLRSNYLSKRVQTRWADAFNEISEAEEDHPEMLNFNGSPDYLPPQHLLDAMVEVSLNQSHPNSYTIHQYESANGNEKLRKVLGRFYSVLMKRQIDPMKEIIVTTGAQHALSIICNAYLDPGDEVILFEPFYPNYYHMIRQAGAHPSYVPFKLSPNHRTNTSYDWVFDKDELTSKFNRKTKMIIINNPNNPTGKTFTKEELLFIGHLADKHNVLILADEVAQWFYFNDNQHVRIATLENFWKRTFTVSSGGKSFSNNGWRIGWVIAPQELMWGLTAMADLTVLSVSTPMQMAFAIGLETELLRWNTTESYFHHLRVQHMRDRDRLIRILEGYGTNIIRPNAGYFIVANLTKIAKHMNLVNETDPRPGMKLSNALRKQIGINTTPLTIFYSLPNAYAYEYFARLALIKSPALFEKLEKRLKHHFHAFCEHKENERGDTRI